MNVRKKFAMLAFVIALAMSFCVMASADDTGDTSKVNRPDNDGTPTEWAYNGDALTQVTFEVKITAAENAPVPNTQFTYTLAPSSTATDTTGGSAPAGLVYFSKDNNNAKVYTTNVAVTAYTAESTPHTEPVPVQFDETALQVRPACGYYRYTLTATTVDAHFTGGAGSLDLIVYINNNKEPYAAILVPTGATPDPNDTNGGNKDVYKSSGNVKVAGFAYTYTTYDVTISNASAGNTVDNTVNFTFTVDFTFPYTATTFDTTTLPVKYRIGSGDLTAFPGTFSVSDGKATGSGTVTIKVGETLTFFGLPDTTVVKVRETNGESYQIESTVNADGSTTTTMIGPNQNYAEDASAFTTMVTIASHVAAIAYNNERGNISPTGVVLRYAPYLLTMGAGVTVLPLSRRYKKREEED